MQLKLIALSAMLAAGATSAGSLPQQCAPMEVLHNGSAGMSYRLDCSAGDWKLQYSGSVPAGTASAVAQYRIQGKRPDGSQFKQTRSVRMPSASLLGQALVREVVQLPNGDLGLRDCPDFGCTVYRPLGGAEQMAQATITIKPEMQRLMDESSRLTTLLNQKSLELDAKTMELTQAQADLAGLLDSTKAAKELTAQTERDYLAREEQLKAQLSQLNAAISHTQHAVAEQTAQRDRGQAEVEQLRTQLTLAHAALSESRDVLTQVVDAQGPQAAELKALQAQHIKDQEALAWRSAQYEAQLESLKTKIRADQAQGAQHAQLAQQLDSLQQQLAASQAQLVEAKAAQTEAEKAGQAQADQAAQRDRLQTQLQGVQQALAQQRAEHAAQIAALSAQLEAAQAEAPAGQEHASQRVSELTQQVRSLQTEVAFLAQELTVVRAAQPIPAPAADAQLLEKVAVLEKAVADAAQSDGALRAEVAAATASRQEALAQAQGLTQKLQQMSAELDQMAASRLEAYEGARDLANQTLDLLSQYEAMEKAKQDADAALASSTNKILELNAKLEAANLTRDIALQAATAANADTDTQHLKTMEVTARLAKSEEDKALALAQRDEALAQLKALQAQLEAAKAVEPAPAKAPTS